MILVGQISDINLSLTDIGDDVGPFPAADAADIDRGLAQDLVRGLLEVMARQPVYYLRHFVDGVDSLLGHAAVSAFALRSQL